MKFSLPFIKKKVEKSLVQVKASPVGSFLVMQNSPMRRSQELKNFAKEGYQENVIVYRCINKITQAVSCVDIEVKENGKEVDDTSGEDGHADAHPAEAILRRPNPSQTWADFITQVITDWLLYGEIFIYRNMVGKEVVELWALSPLHMKVVPSMTGMPQAFEHGDGSTKKIFPVDQMTGDSLVFFSKTYNPLDTWRGLSPLHAAGLAADTHNAGLDWNHSLLKNGARPSGILEFGEGDAPDDTLLNRLRERFKMVIQGHGNAGEIPMLFGGAKFTETSQNARDMDFIALMEATEKYVASAYGVPLPLISNDASTFNNMDVAKEMLYTDTVLPLLNHFLESFGRWLLPHFGEGLEYCYDKDSIDALEGVRQRRNDRVAKLVTAGLISPDEGREMIGLDALGGAAAELYVSSSVIPMGDSGMSEVAPEDVSLAKALRRAGYDMKYIKKILND